jgi:hypothetical protein
LISFAKKDFTLDGVRFHGRVCGESVQLANSIWLALGTSAVHAESEEALLAPLATPGVTHDPELLTEFFLLGFGSLTVSDYCDTMVYTVILRTALKSLLSHDSRLVELELGIGVDTNPNWLFHEY